MQSMGECVEVATKLADLVGKLPQATLRFLRRVGDDLGSGSEVESKDRNSLAEVVVNLNRDSASFLFLGLDQHASELVLSLAGSTELLLLEQEIDGQP